MATRADAPVLEPGDPLTREELHRRYLARPDIKKAELIDGVVYAPSPVRVRHHGRSHAFVMAWLGAYVAVKKEAYRRNGVREYVVWRVLDEAIDGFLQDGEEIGEVVAFMATDAASFVVGETIHVNGGFYMS